MIVVLDTSVMVSALMNEKGAAAKIFSLILDGNFEILYDNRIIFEYLEVLSRKGFGFNLNIINDAMHFVRYEGIFNEAPFNDMDYPAMKFHDDADRKFYEVYKAGEADYLITGTPKHFPDEPSIILPVDFIKMYEKHKS
jgi:putative PIN family toxin of toxin-antitoxin system